MHSVKGELAHYIDHTLLRPDAKIDEIEKLCREAMEYGFFSVCIQPFYVEAASQWLASSSVKVCSVVGFPLGQNTSDIKVQESQTLQRLGAHELDMVINVAALKNRDYNFVENDIHRVVENTSEATIKVIIETSLLSDDEILEASKICMNAGAEFVKTSTGFGSRGASLHDIELIHSVTKGQMGIKASGGIKTLAFATELISAGATRIGTSSSVELVKAAQ